jgi:hypothetical protein
MQWTMQCTVKICEFSIEILFHVVMDKYLKYDVLIGREILGQGFGVSIDANKFALYRTNTVNTLSSIVELDFMDTINNDVDLSQSDKAKLAELLTSYAPTFIKGIPTRRVTTGELEIRLTDINKTVVRRPYRQSTEEKLLVRSKIQELLASNVIRPSCSPFASPMLLVKKKDGSDRLCIDYRELNANTISDKYPLPLISDQIDRLRGSLYFSSLDMASGFYQIPIKSNSIERTAFVTTEGQYEFLAVPFGVKNASSVFQRAIIQALGDVALSYAVVYIDDVLIVAGTKEEAFIRLKEVLQRLSKAGFSFNINKCTFLKSKVEYLGYQIENGEIRPNPKKIQALAALPPPQTVTQLRQFIGLSSYFRQFIPKIFRKNEALVFTDVKE